MKVISISKRAKYKDETGELRGAFETFEASQSWLARHGLRNPRLLTVDDFRKKLRHLTHRQLRTMSRNAGLPTELEEGELREQLLGLVDDEVVVEAEEESGELDAMTTDELKQIAADRGVENYWCMKRETLLERLR